jgi:hypothetical protein
MIITFFLIIYLFIIKFFVGNNYSSISHSKENSIIIYGLTKGKRSEIISNLYSYFNNIFTEEE